MPRARAVVVALTPMRLNAASPGVLAGQYTAEQIKIDLVRLCAAARARLVIAEACGLDLERQMRQLRGLPPLRFDALSIGIGSVPTYEAVRIEDAAALVPIKPMQTLLSRLRTRLRQVTGPSRDAVRIVVVGGGAGGVEMAFCLPPYVRQVCGGETRSVSERLPRGRIAPESDERSESQERAERATPQSVWRARIMRCAPVASSAAAHSQAVQGSRAGRKAHRT